MDKEVIAWNPPVEWVKEVIEKAGTRIGSVYFNKRSDGELRKMSYRSHVQNPTVAAIPKGIAEATKDEDNQKCWMCGKTGKDLLPECRKFLVDITPKKETYDRKEVDKSNDQITVFDTNKVVRDKEGKVIGRGAWRTIPLENVVRIKNCGIVYTIKRFEDSLKG